MGARPGPYPASPTRPLPALSRQQCPLGSAVLLMGWDLWCGTASGPTPCLTPRAVEVLATGEAASTVCGPEHDGIF